MRTLVLGGIRSGKSDWAESYIGDRAGSGCPVRYLATGPAADSDPSWAQRLAAHRARRPSNWVTVESPDVAAQLRAEPATATLVDDIGGWLTAAMDRADAWSGGPIDAPVADLIDAIGDFRAPLVLVSPEVGLTLVPATAAGRRFADELGALNQRLAAVNERVVLVVAGVAVPIKPERKS
ncbi:MAG: bifunctional adenosylcobinamide kinase/adenosylcobinamide-phosphate guanylyltransferase [Mycobacterium sp.]|nr:bifunctional adenosylcobinamide kinase/adenosylcobinamide-phosphate guanylyltransferase [Mycobacterium sp.]